MKKIATLAMGNFLSRRGVALHQSHQSVCKSRVRVIPMRDLGKSVTCINSLSVIELQPTGATWRDLLSAILVLCSGNGVKTRAFSINRSTDPISSSTTSGILCQKSKDHSAHRLAHTPRVSRQQSPRSRQ
jgi:hypothetical protein